jgi:hypothetical protein
VDPTGLSRNGWRESVHTALDIGGLAPGVGAIADVANAALYATEGNYLQAGVSLVSVIPIADLIKVGKYAWKGGKVLAEHASVKLAQRAAQSASKMPENGVFSRVISADHYKAWREGKAPLGGKDGAWITAAEDLAGVTTSSGVQKRLSLFNDAAGTVPKEGPFVKIDFTLPDGPGASGLSSPIQTVPPRGYGFVPGGKTGGGAREWLMPSDAPINVTSTTLIK